VFVCSGKLRNGEKLSTFFFSLFGSPFGLIGGVRGLGQLLGSGGQPLLGPLQILLEQLDATVQSGDLTLSLREKKKRVGLS